MMLSDVPYFWFHLTWSINNVVIKPNVCTAGDPIDVEGHWQFGNVAPSRVHICQLNAASLNHCGVPHSDPNFTVFRPRLSPLHAQDTPKADECVPINAS